MADVYSAKNGDVVEAFLQRIVHPTFEGLQARIDSLLKEVGTDVSAIFLMSDLAVLKIETGQAFCLSIQSIWERQLRRYVEGCAEVLDVGDQAKHIKMARAPQWEQIEEAFFRVRGIRLSNMPCCAELSMLHLLGNACRHGAGKSMDSLWEKHPELWPMDSGDGIRPGIGPVISAELLQNFCESIRDFWDEVEYIYNESISAKSASLERKLQIEREARAGAQQHGFAGPP